MEIGLEFERMPTEPSKRIYARCQTCKNPIMYHPDMAASDIIINYIRACEIRAGIWKSELVPCPTCSDGEDGLRAKKRERAAQEFFDQRFTHANIPARMRSFDFASFPAHGALADVEAALAYGEGTLRRMRSNAPYSLYLYGAYGTGKTGLGISLLRFFVKAGQGVFFLSVNDYVALARNIRFKEPSAELERIEQHLETLAIVMIDDLGREKVFSNVADRLLLLLEARRNKGLVTIITSNYSPEEYEKLMAKADIYVGPWASRINESYQVYKVKSRCLR